MEILVRFYSDLRRTLMLPVLRVAILARTIYRILDRGVIFLAVEEEDKIVGLIALDVFPSDFSDCVMMSDKYTYVLPEYRTATHGRDLLKAARDYAIMNKVPMQLSILSGEDIDRKDKLYQRLGLRKVGFTYTVNV